MRENLAFVLIRVGFPATVNRIVSIAGAESMRLGHNYIGSEHLLCALARLPNSPLGFHSTLHDTEIERIRNGVISVDSVGMSGRIVKIRPITPRLKSILKIAASERSRLKHLTVSQSLLLGIVIEGGGVAPRVLKKLNYDLEAMKRVLEAPNQSPEPVLSSGTSPAGQEPRRP